MKSIFFHFLFILSFSLNGQISGEVYYAFTPNKISKEKKEKHKELYYVIDKLNASAADFNFILKFNENESIFKLIDASESGLNQMAISYAENIISKGKYYFNKKENILLRESHGYDEYTLIKSYPLDIEWKITKDTKRIGEYLCVKATRIETKTNNKKEREFVVEAWFCPDIPVTFGPKEFVGLPGLVLEVKDPMFTFSAIHIDLGRDNMNIPTLYSKHVITEEENAKYYRGLNNKE